MLACMGVWLLHVLENIGASMRKSMAENALHFRVTAECAISKARVACMTLPHGVVDTPVFMPVGTQGTMKGVTPEQLKALPLDCQIMLGNTYHLGSKPVRKLVLWNLLYIIVRVVMY